MQHFFYFFANRHYCRFQPPMTIEKQTSESSVKVCLYWLDFRKCSCKHSNQILKIIFWGQ
jgi:hypothetical protein